MPREIIGKGLRFSLRHAPCAHICRYCLISESRKRSALPFARFEQLVHRFHDWRLSERPDLDIGVFVGPSFDYDIDTLKGVAIAVLEEVMHEVGIESAKMNDRKAQMDVARCLKRAGWERYRTRRLIDGTRPWRYRPLDRNPSSE
jgi:hypothetical protein